MLVSSHQQSNVSNGAGHLNEMSSNFYSSLPPGSTSSMPLTMSNAVSGILPTPGGNSALLSNTGSLSLGGGGNVAQPPPLRPGSVYLSKLIESAVLRIYVELTHLCEILSSKTDNEKKIELVHFLHRSRHLIIRIIALVKWTAYASKVEKCEKIMAFLEQQSAHIMDCANRLMTLARETLVSARLSYYSVEYAVEILSYGTYTRLPHSLLTIVKPTKPMTEQQKEETLAQLTGVLLYRLSATEIPLPMRNVKIFNGRAQFTVPNEFEITMTVMSDRPDYPWRILKLKILVQDPVVGNGQDLVHPQQLIFLQSQVQRRILFKHFDPRRPLRHVYDMLHSFVLSLQLDVLCNQADRLIREKWADALVIEQYEPSVRLVVGYWRDATSTSLMKTADGAGKSIVGLPGGILPPSVAALLMSAGAGVLSENAFYSRICVEVDPDVPQKPLRITHYPPLPLALQFDGAAALQSQHMSLECLLNRFIIMRSLARLQELRHHLLPLIDSDIVQEKLPPCLLVPLLSSDKQCDPSNELPCSPEECVRVRVDQYHGHFIVEMAGMGAYLGPHQLLLGAAENDSNQQWGGLSTPSRHKSQHPLAVCLHELQALLNTLPPTVSVGDSGSSSSGFGAHTTPEEHYEWLLRHRRRHATWSSGMETRFYALLRRCFMRIRLWLATRRVYRVLQHSNSNACYPVPHLPLLPLEGHPAIKTLLIHSSAVVNKKTQQSQQQQQVGETGRFVSHEHVVYIPLLRQEHHFYLVVIPYAVPNNVLDMSDPAVAAGLVTSSTHSHSSLTCTCGIDYAYFLLQTVRETAPEPVNSAHTKGDPTATGATMSSAASQQQMAQLRPVFWRRINISHFLAELACSVALRDEAAGESFCGPLKTPAHWNTLFVDMPQGTQPTQSSSSTAKRQRAKDVWRQLRQHREEALGEASESKRPRLQGAGDTSETEMMEVEPTVESHPGGQVVNVYSVAQLLPRLLLYLEENILHSLLYRHLQKAGIDYDLAHSDVTGFFTVIDIKKFPDIRQNMELLNASKTLNCRLTFCRLYTMKSSPRTWELVACFSSSMTSEEKCRLESELHQQMSSSTDVELSQGAWESLQSNTAAGAADMTGNSEHNSPHLSGRLMVRRSYTTQNADQLAPLLEGLISDWTALVAMHQVCGALELHKSIPSGIRIQEYSLRKLVFVYGPAYTYMAVLRYGANNQFSLTCGVNHRQDRGCVIGHSPNPHGLVKDHLTHILNTTGDIIALMNTMLESLCLLESVHSLCIHHQRQFYPSDLQMGDPVPHMRVQFRSPFSLLLFFREAVGLRIDLRMRKETSQPTITTTTAHRRPHRHEWMHATDSVLISDAYRQCGVASLMPLPGFHKFIASVKTFFAIANETEAGGQLILTLSQLRRLLQRQLMPSTLENGTTFMNQPSEVPLSLLELYLGHAHLFLGLLQALQVDPVLRGSTQLLSAAANNAGEESSNPAVGSAVSGEVAAASDSLVVYQGGSASSPWRVMACYLESPELQIRIPHFKVRCAVRLTPVKQNSAEDEAGGDTDDVEVVRWCLRMRIHQEAPNPELILLNSDAMLVLENYFYHVVLSYPYLCHALIAFFRLLMVRSASVMKHVLQLMNRELVSSQHVQDPQHVSPHRVHLCLITRVNLPVSSTTSGTVGAGASGGSSAESAGLPSPMTPISVLGAPAVFISADWLTLQLEVLHRATQRRHFLLVRCAFTSDNVELVACDGSRRVQNSVRNAVLEWRTGLQHYQQQQQQALAPPQMPQGHLFALAEFLTSRPQLWPADGSFVNSLTTGPISSTGMKDNIITLS